jgi:hypothetical protein
VDDFLDFGKSESVKGFVQGMEKACLFVLAHGIYAHPKKGSFQNIISPQQKK